MGALWHPEAIRRVHIDAGGFQGGGHKIVWHTTETTGLPNYGGSAPHFTLDPATGRLWQHIPLNRAARALKAGGPNFWNTVQVELLGFARDTHSWPDATYQRIAKLTRWIEGNFTVPRVCSVDFIAGVKHLASLDAFKRYEGHIGHQHVPGNDHWDPGRLKIALILDGGGGGGGRDLARGDRGDDVRVLQSVLVKRGYRVLEPHVNGVFGPTTEAFVVHFQWRHQLNIDGVVGALTRAALGLGATPDGLREVEKLELGLGEPLSGHAAVEPLGGEE